MPHSYYFKNKIAQFGRDVFVLICNGVTAAFPLIGLQNMLIRSIAYVLPGLFNLRLPTVTLGLGASVIFIKHPVHALLCLIAVFFNTVLLYLAAGAEFLALVFLIVYVGAIAILFLFVIRLLNVKELIAVPRRKRTVEDYHVSAVAVPMASSFTVTTPVKLGDFRIQNAEITRSVTYSTLESFVQYVS